MSEESAENCHNPFVFQIIDVGAHSDVFEVKMLLSNVVDPSTLKITVKFDNLRVAVHRCDSANFSSKGIYPKYSADFLIPVGYDGSGVRANFDGNSRVLLISRCLENSVFIRKGDYLNFEKMSNCVKTALNFRKIPDFYATDDRSYFAAELRIEGLKVATASLAADDVLNVRLYEIKNPTTIRNINFFIPHEADAQLVSVELFGNETICIRAPLRRTPPAR